MGIVTTADFSPIIFQLLFSPREIVGQETVNAVFVAGRPSSAARIVFKFIPPRKQNQPPRFFPDGWIGLSASPETRRPARKNSKIRTDIPKEERSMNVDDVLIL